MQKKWLGKQGLPSFSVPICLLLSEICARKLPWGAPACGDCSLRQEQEQLPLALGPASPIATAALHMVILFALHTPSHCARRRRDSHRASCIDLTLLFISVFQARDCSRRVSHSSLTKHSAHAQQLHPQSSIMAQQQVAPARNNTSPVDTLQGTMNLLVSRKWVCGGDARAN